MDMKIHCSHTAMVPIAELKAKFNPKNRNTHPPAQIDRLAEILKYQGARKAAVLSKRSGFLTAGHGRIMAAERAGWKEYPVDYQDYESDEQEFADLTADNAVSLWAELDLAGINQDVLEFGADFDLDMLGIKDFQLVDPEQLEPGCDEDAVPEFVEPKSKLGDIYQLGRHRLMCGDSSDTSAIDSLLDGETIEAILTDPPYGIGIDGQKESKNVNPKHNRKAHEFRGWDSARPGAGIFNYIAGSGAHAVVFGGNYFADLLPASRGWIYWSKGQDGLTMSDGELAWTNLDKPLRAVTVNRAALKGSVHPTQKPLEVLEFCLDYVGDCENVLDLFGGSGSTLIACEKTNRKCFMMELDPHYCDVIVARWEKYTGQKAELLNG